MMLCVLIIKISNYTPLFKYWNEKLNSLDALKLLNKADMGMKRRKKKSYVMWLHAASASFYETQQVKLTLTYTRRRCL